MIIAVLAQELNLSRMVFKVHTHGILKFYKGAWL